MKALLVLSLIAVFSLFLACGEFNTDSKGSEVADSFATAYFNYDYHKSLKYVHPTSWKWIVYAASQVRQEDVDMLRSMAEPPTIEIEEHTRDKVNDSLVYITVKVSNFFNMDTIGTSGHMVQDARFSLPVLYAKGKWLVRLDELPRPIR
uniref:Lipoprotein n=1 Tax=Prevotella sp. GTC17259 TaxID=3236795 RepID=A0AB33J1D1_9BACT